MQRHRRLVLAGIAFVGVLAALVCACGDDTSLGSGGGDASADASGAYDASGGGGDDASGFDAQGFEAGPDPCASCAPGQYCYGVVYLVTHAPPDDAGDAGDAAVDGALPQPGFSCKDTPDACAGGGGASPTCGCLLDAGAAPGCPNPSPFCAESDASATGRTTVTCAVGGP